MKSDLKKTWNKEEQSPDQKLPQGKGQNLRDSGPTPVACGGCGAKAPPLAARPNLNTSHKDRIGDER